MDVSRIVEVGKDEKVRTTIYISRRVHEIVKKIADREGSDVSASNIYERLGARHGMVHFKGNPQMSLAPFTGPVGFTCFLCEGHFPVLKKVEWNSGLIAPSCTDCLEKNRLTVTKVLDAWRRGDKVRYKKGVRKRLQV